MNIIADDVDRFSMPQKGQPKILVLVYYKPYFSLPYLHKLDEKLQSVQIQNQISNIDEHVCEMIMIKDIALQFRFETQT